MKGRGEGRERKCFILIHQVGGGKEVGSREGKGEGKYSVMANL